MTEKQARQLLPGTVVVWGNDPKDLGTVRALGIGGVHIDWEDGQLGWIAYQDMGDVSIYTPEAS